MLMPESRNGCRSAAVNVSGSLNHLACLLKSSVNTLSMSITVARPIRSIACREYSVVEPANTRKRPRLIIGAATTAAVAIPALLNISRRLMNVLSFMLFRLDWQGDIRRILAGAKYLLRCRLKVSLSRLENVRYKLLRVSIDNGKPRALHLDHNTVALLKSMIVGGKTYLVVVNRVRDERLGFLESLQIPPTKDVAGNHELVATHRRVCFKLIGIDVDHLHDPVAVCS